MSLTSLLDRTFVQPAQNLGQAIVHEVSDIYHPLVHAVEQPIINVVNDSKVVVGGLYQAVQGIFGLAPYWVGGWLVWSAFQTYFPEEAGYLTDSVGRAAKRMRL